MIEAGLEMLAISSAGLAFLVFLRVGAAFFLLPILGDTAVSPRVRLGLALAVTVVITPLVADPMAGLPTRSAFFAAAAAEVMAGLLIGFAVRGIFWMIQTGSAMAAQAISLSQILGNQIEQPQAAMGQIVFVAALALATILQFHTTVVAALARSYDVVPLGTAVPAALIELWSVKAVSAIYRVGFGLAGPFLILAVLYNLTLGVVNKAMPQLMVAFVGAPAVTGLGLVFLLLAAPVILATWKSHVLGLTLLQGLP